MHLSGITLALSPACREVATGIVTRAGDRSPKIAVDINYWSELWDPTNAAEVLSALVQDADLVVCTLEDARDLFGTTAERADVATDLAQRFDISRSSSRRVRKVLGGRGRVRGPRGRHTGRGRRQDQRWSAVDAGFMPSGPSGAAPPI